ncbi:hypothetical protein [Rubricoccus marinus]|uniref:Curlin n=1 Tax=Rubricoccus marinus TaxID=716817 RepID=A0A259U2M6_9BACT|nr:hypothetical protein [Rubricoccus marinus]OZC04232.1 hypothetical protein BSZ36_15335 [Rubricoccus marinus]
MRLNIITFVFSLLASSASAQSVAYVDQLGSRNTVELVQVAVGGGSDAQITQQGAGDHVARLEQSGGAYADILQSGSGNVLAGFDAMGYESIAASALSTDASRIVLSQIGSGNRAFVQQGGGAVAHIIQTGHSNTVLVRQSAGSFP